MAQIVNIDTKRILVHLVLSEKLLWGLIVAEHDSMSTLIDAFFGCGLTRIGGNWTSEMVRWSSYYQVSTYQQ